jgi:Putative peptidoglycan binding domain
LGADIAQLEANGLFVPLPLEEPDKSKDASRIKTIRNRLSNLGYLPQDSGRPYLDEELKEAIRRFQEEADLIVDGWVGEQTWTALQELVGFESSINLLRWFRRGHIKTPLKRAIGLRLFVVGLMEKAPTTHPVDPTEGMTAFGRVWRILNLGPVTSRASISPEWVTRLFDQDGLIGRLASTKVPSTAQERPSIHGFILNIAKIELWLAGYKIKPTGYDLQPHARGG